MQQFFYIFSLNVLKGEFNSFRCPGSASPHVLYDLTAPLQNFENAIHSEHPEGSSSFGRLHYAQTPQPFAQSSLKDIFQLERNYYSPGPQWIG